ncbi:MAG: transcription antitermination factor NusB [Chromatiaceae bacterium]
MVGHRSQARRYAVLAIYQWQLTGQDAREIARHFFDDPVWVDELADSLAEMEEEAGAAPQGRSSFDRKLFRELVHGVPERLAELDTRLKPALDRGIEQVDPVERAILRLGVYELLYCPGVPYRVAINEAVDLAKLFGAEQGHRYVNGVLDRVARDVRPAEAGAGATGRERAP